MILGKEILWLSEKDVEALLPVEEAVAAVEEAFRLYGEGKTQLPSKIYLDFSPINGDLRSMPAFVQSSPPSAGVKIVNSHPGNPAKGLPAVSGILIMIDPETGLPLMMSAAGTLTGLRTGAAGAVATKYLAKKGPWKVALLGCGRQAWTQLLAHQAVGDISEARAWGQTLEESKKFSEKAKADLGLTVLPAETAGQAASGADVIITTTPVHSAILGKNDVPDGAHINAIGADAPGKQELEPALLQKARVFVDEWNQASHGGEINLAVAQGLFSKEDCAGELGEVVCGKKPGRQNDSDITIFDSTGLAIQDVSVGRLLLSRAEKSKKGQVLQFNG